MKSNVKELMKQKGVTVDEMVRASGLARGTVMRARDHRINFCSLSTLSRIASVLGVEVPSLFSSKDE